MRNSKFSARSCRFVLCLALTLGFFQISNFAQGQSGVWERKAESEMAGRGKATTMPNKYLVYGLSQGALKQVLDQAPMEFTEAARDQEVILELPAPDGTLQRFRIEESPIIEPELATKFPELILRNSCKAL